MSKRILIADDAIFMRTMLKDILIKMGCEMIMEYDKNAKCVMCSAMGQQTMVVQAIQTGAKDFIVKPFNAERIAESVNKALG